MKIIIYGTIQDKNTIIESLSGLRNPACDNIEFELHSDYDNFANAALHNDFDAVFVTADNVNGMEGVYAAKRMFPDKPVIWLSNDTNFGVHSYRCNVAFFHEKPITTDVLEQALAKINI